jgi:hypothetical protein
VKAPHRGFHGPPISTQTDQDDTDPVDARSVAVVALRTSGLRQIQVDDTTVALRLLVDRPA